MHGKEFQLEHSFGVGDRAGSRVILQGILICISVSIFGRDGRFPVSSASLCARYHKKNGFALKFYFYKTWIFVHFFRILNINENLNFITKTNLNRTNCRWLPSTSHGLWFNIELTLKIYDSYTWSGSLALVSGFQDSFKFLGIWKQYMVGIRNANYFMMLLG